MGVERINSRRSPDKTEKEEEKKTEEISLAQSRGGGGIANFLLEIFVRLCAGFYPLVHHHHQRRYCSRIFTLKALMDTTQQAQADTCKSTY